MSCQAEPRSLGCPTKGNNGHFFLARRAPFLAGQLASPVPTAQGSHLACFLKKSWLRASPRAGEAQVWVCKGCVAVPEHPQTKGEVVWVAEQRKSPVILPKERLLHAHKHPEKPSERNNSTKEPEGSLFFALRLLWRGLWDVPKAWSWFWVTVHPSASRVRCCGTTSGLESL